ncbi:ArsR/SmtB family transcription factor [Silanimonas lenta]|uniref:ArsR/SmtB family transcription factor n=1 Tax=Silanimonas lenta TaxID=265429 RepID=UPI000418AE16|nr:helix-turn-helix transcriptional regulator [Silanimonas lenta]
MNQSDAVAALAALAQPHRLAAFRALVQAGHGGLSVGELREALGLPPATLTGHLNVLRRAGLVHDAREGRSIRVHAALGRMDALLAYLTENCCGGQPCAPRAPACY